MKKSLLFLGTLAIGVSLFASEYTGIKATQPVVALCSAHEECVEGEESNAIEPKGIACDCGGNMTSTKNYGSWYITGSKSCSHGYADRIHKVEARQVTTNWKCGNCGRGHSQNNTETKETCVKI